MVLKILPVSFKTAAEKFKGKEKKAVLWSGWWVNIWLPPLRDAAAASEIVHLDIF